MARVTRRAGSPSLCCALELRSEAWGSETDECVGAKRQICGLVNGGEGGLSPLGSQRAAALEHRLCTRVHGTRSALVLAVSVTHALARFFIGHHRKIIVERSEYRFVLSLVPPQHFYLDRWRLRPLLLVVVLGLWRCALARSNQAILPMVELPRHHSPARAEAPTLSVDGTGLVDKCKQTDCRVSRMGNWGEGMDMELRREGGCWWPGS